jgi:hypothetical protein
MFLVLSWGVDTVTAELSCFLLATHNFIATQQHAQTKCTSLDKHARCRLREC